MAIKETNSSETIFYFLMGKFFADRKIIKEMDCQIYNENNMDWFLYFNKEGEVIGFLSLEPKKDYLYLDNFYVVEKERGNGIGRKLIEHCLNEVNKTIKLISRNENAIKIFENNGFKKTRKNGRYYKMEKLILKGE